MEWKRYIDCYPNKHIEKILIFDGRSEEIDIAYIAPDESLFIDYYNPRKVTINDELYWMALPNKPERSTQEQCAELRNDNDKF